MALTDHLEKLRHFSRAAQFNSIREASQAIGMSQAGLSKSISALEEVLETQLFLRSKNGLILTKEGQEVLLTSKIILTEAKDLELRLRSHRVAKAPQKLRIGMYDSIAVYFGNELSKYLKVIYPFVRLEITADSSSMLLERIKAGTLDLAVGVNYDKISVNNLSFFKLFEDHYSFYISPKILNDIESVPFLLHEHARDSKGSTVYEYLKTEIKDRGFHHVLNFETLKTMTVQGFGVGILPTQVAKPLLKSGQLVSVQISKKKTLFGPHIIGFLVREKLLFSYGEFAKDVYRLGEEWSKA